VNFSTGAGTPDEEFEQAVERFRSFLVHQGHSPNVIWIEPTNIVLTGDRRILVYHAEEEGGAELAARKVFEQGIAEGNGVVINGLFPKKDATYAFIWFPRDRAEAEYEMVPTGVKLRVNISETYKVAVFRSRERWRVLSQRHGGIQFMTMELFR